MSTRFLLDTNICIYIAKANPPAVLARFRKARAGSIAISAVTYGELLYGAAKSRDAGEVRRVLERFTEQVPVLPIDESAASQYGALRAVLEQRGEVIGNNDLWIAAHALARKLVLVTNNEREFRRVPALKLQNWAR
ncbi:MAG TPA: type II toxin-antitoxin system VapC family toxin [Pseudomonadota bacterium]|nr:type II toxin-antitoxin system VapC family toxin [Xanthomonadales bacterium]HQW63575.1 type II toxin-antitoxin system VapC family toxin [Pseudomonadota bacterium]HQY37666.1 type II toxin-antitoxin system VapC family toxin [Pseudomonadota bacterium]HRA37550.1 type II toxin-antitoxin system VapC family toxin [Pseudomonadota bacterium]